jgi:hypothetical protein
MLSHTQKVEDERRGDGREEDEKREKMRRLEEKGRRRNQRGMIAILLVRSR